MENIYGPVTSLEVYENYIFSGCCNTVSVFDIDSGQELSRLVALHGETVHGIRKGNASNNSCPELCVFGGKQWRVIELKHSDISLAKLESKSKIVYTIDWIWDALWLSQHKTGTTECLAFCLGHNSVVIWSLQDMNILYDAVCVENCIIYCAHLIGSTLENLIIAAGTVFNKVVFWSGNNFFENNKRQSTPVLHYLDGHKGAIFSVKYNEGLRRVCSVSDDRSIRMWQLSFQTNPVSPSFKDWTNMKSELILNLFGHSARVWEIVLMPHCFASVGEDAICCVWDYEGNVLNKFSGHKGRSIWSLTCSEEENEVFTGGGDSSIRKWKINQVKQIDEDISLSIYSSADEDFPRSVALIDFGKLLVMTNSGALYLYNLETPNKCHTLLHDDRFKSYTVLSTSTDGKQIALGNISGLISIIEISESGIEIKRKVEKSLFEGKVLSIICVNGDFLVSGPNGECTVIDAKTNPLNIVKRHNLMLPASKHRWLTCACKIKLDETNPPKAALICGDKDGSIYNYHINKTHPVQRFYRVHGKTGVTFASILDKHIVTTGRDGVLRFWEIQNGSLLQLYSDKVTKHFTWIEKVIPLNDDLLIYGFFSNQLVVWSKLKNEAIVTADCGGGHRSWDIQQQDKQFRISYLKAKEVKVLKKQNSMAQTIIKPPLHGRELCDAKFLRHLFGESLVVVTASEDTTINIGRYKDINGLLQFKPTVNLKGSLCSVRTLAITKSHRCSSQDHLITCHLLISGGGRAELRAWRINVREPGDSIFPLMSKDFCKVEQLCTYFLGKCRHRSHWRTRKHKSDPDTRIMCVDVTTIQQTSDHVVSIVCSDGSIRVYVFDESKMMFYLQWQSFYHNACVLKVQHFCFQKFTFETCLTDERQSNCSNHEIETDTDLFIFSSSTCGDVAVWKWSYASNITRIVSSKSDDNEVSVDHSQEQPTPCFNTRCHQSGINSLQVEQISENRCLLLTGGDDNALCLQVLELSEEDFVVKCSFSQVNAHAAQITGVWIFSEKLVLSASVDQRLNVWEVNCDDASCIRMNLKRSHIVPIADIANIDVLGNSESARVLICGEGLCLYKIDF